MRKTITLFLTLFILFSTISGTAMYFYWKPEIEQKIQEVHEENIFENLDISNYKERINVLLLGVDTLSNEKKQTGTRSDTMMILSVDPITKTGFILSIPRDSYVQIHGQEKMTRINHAHSYGGTELALSTVKDFIKIPIHHYIKVDYNALFKVVDDLGGIEFDVPIDMNYSDTQAKPPLKINLKAGIQTLNGEQAMGLLRFRKDYPDRDLGRIRTQQAFIETVLKKLASPASIPKIPKHIETAYQYVETDMTLQDILSLIKIGISIDLSYVEKATIPGKPTMKNGSSVIEVDYDQMDELIKYLLSGKYISTKNSDEETKEKKVDSKNDIQENKNQKDKSLLTTSNGNTTNENKNDINDKLIVVLNGSGTKNIARHVSDVLKIRNIEVDSSGNADHFDYNTTTIYYKDDANFANQIMEILKTGIIKKGTKEIQSSEPDIIIVIGKDFG